MERQPSAEERGGRLDPERYARQRRLFRRVGPVVLGIGTVCLLVATVDFFIQFYSSGDMPKLFFLGFIGMPLMFVGGVMTMLGYKRSIARYYASELSPVASETVNYLGHSTRDGVRAMGGALREGLEGRPGVARHCEQCGERLGAGARFCQGCGVAVARVDACGGESR